MSFVSNLYYFVFGLFASAYLYVLFRKKENDSQTGKGTTNTKDDKERIYINIFFLDRREFIRNIIRSKVPKNYRIMRALAKRAGVALLEKGIVERVAGGLCKTIPDRLAIMGVKCTAAIVFTQSAFVSIEVNLQGLDLQQFLSFNAGQNVADKLLLLLDRYALPAIVDYFKSFILSFLKGKLIVQLPTTMKEKLYNKMTAEVEIIACTEEEQGPFLVQTIAQLNATAQSNTTASVTIAPSSGGTVSNLSVSSNSGGVSTDS